MAVFIGKRTFFKDVFVGKRTFFKVVFVGKRTCYQKNIIFAYN